MGVSSPRQQHKARRKVKMMPEMEKYYEHAQRLFDEQEALDVAFRNLEFVYRRLLRLKKVRSELDKIQECNVPEILDLIEDKVLRAMACIVNLTCGTPENGERYDYERLKNVLSERMKFGVQV
jgi:hypothetical protein